MKLYWDLTESTIRKLIALTSVDGDLQKYTFNSALIQVCNVKCYHKLYIFR